MTLFNYADFLSRYEKEIGPFKHKGAFAIYYSEIIPSNLMMIGHNPGGNPARENRARNSVKSGFHEYVNNAGGSEESYKLAKIMNGYLRRLLDLNSDQIRKIPKINIVFRRSKNAAEFAQDHDGLSIWCAAKEEQPPSSNNEKGSKNKPSNIGACNTASLPLIINKPNETNAPLIYADFSAKCSDDGKLVRRLRCNGSISSSMLIYIYIYIYRLSCLICGFSFTKGPNEMQRRCTNISKHCPPSAINR